MGIVSIMLWHGEYITKAKTHGFSKRRFLGFGLFCRCRVLLLPALLLQDVGWTVCNQRDVVFVVGF